MVGIYYIFGVSVWFSSIRGSDISGSKLCKDVRASKFVFFSLVLSFSHQDEDLGLTSPRITVNKELGEAVLMKTLSRSDRKFSNSTLSWLGDLETIPIYNLQSFTIL